MVLHLRLFRSSQESWLSEIVMIMNYPKPKLLLAQAQAASPIFTSYGPSGLRPFNPKYQQQWLMRGEARSRFMSHNYTQNPPFYEASRLMNFVRWSICGEKNISIRKIFDQDQLLVVDVIRRKRCLWGKPETRLQAFHLSLLRSSPGFHWLDK